MLSFLIKIKDAALDILFPRVCFGCQKYLPEKDASILCENCHSLLELNRTFFCPTCLSRIPKDAKICHRDSLYILGAATNYGNSVVQNLVQSLKYKGLENIAPFFGKILISYFEDVLRHSSIILDNFIVIPIPLYPKRQRQRGFNQSKLISEAVSRHFNLPLSEILSRIKNTEPQVKLRDNKKRMENVLNSFRVKNTDAVRGKNIIVIDDVFTSGATMNEAVKTLKEAGARRVIALVAAKAS